MFSKLPSNMIPLSMVMALGLTRLTQKKLFCFQHPSTKERIRGEYENKIRRHSPPEKIFETFATIKENDDIFMSQADLFKAICPYNYAVREESEEDKKKRLEEFQSTSLLKFTDVDKDGKISLYEYFIVVTLLQVKRNEIIEFFKEILKGEEKITREHFLEFLEFLNKNSRVKLTITSIMPDPRRVKLNSDEYKEIVKKLTDQMFENREFIPLQDFIKFRDDLVDDIFRFEFNSFDVNKEDNTISGEDFAKSLICFLDIPTVPKILKNLDKKEFDAKISLEQYMTFHGFLHNDIDKLTQEIEKRGVITKKRLRVLMEKYCKKMGANIDNQQIDIFLQVLDSNGNGRIDTHEFTGIVQERTFYGGKEKQSSLQKPYAVLIEKLLSIRSKAEKIYDIIME